MRNLISLVITILCLMGFLPQVQAAEASKERLVLMPVRGVDILIADVLARSNGEPKDATNEEVQDNSFEAYKRKQMEEFEAFKRGAPSAKDIERRKQADAKALAERIAREDKRLQAAIEEVLAEGLGQSYEVFSGEEVLKASPAAAKKECDETPCIIKVAEAFQASFAAIATITKREYGYFLELSIKNITNQKVVYANSTPCRKCSEFKVVIKFKELSNIPAPGLARAPAEPVAAVAPQAAPVEGGGANCYADEFVKICAKPADGAKSKIPSFTFVATNLTDETLFIGSYHSPQLLDDEGSSCNDYRELLGINSVNKGWTNEPGYSRIPAGKSINISYRWNCGKVLGSEFSSSMFLQRLKDGSASTFDVTIPGIRWK